MHTTLRCQRWHRVPILLTIMAVAATVAAFVSEPLQAARSGADHISSNSQSAIRNSQFTSFSVEQIKSYPFPTELTASTTGSRIAWAFNERRARNVWAAEGPELKPRALTKYDAADGQELTSLSISADGKYVVYVRGGDHGSN